MIAFPSSRLLLCLSLLRSSHSTSFLPFLNFTSPSPYIFHSLATLLQGYPQTLFPNGHTIASVTIPQHTLLYHGRHDDNPIPSPEWLAMDIEMAYGIMGNMPDSRMLTFRTRRDIKAVYFDGTSANLMGEGTKAQMVLLYNGTDGIPRRGGWGRPPGRDHDHQEWKGGDDDHPSPLPRWNPLEDEYFRARGLCKWLKTRGLGGAGWGYEAIVRMNAGFEVIWCDFESPSLKLVSNLNVSAPRLTYPGSAQAGQLLDPREALFGARAGFKIQDDEGPHGPGMTDPREPFRDSANWFWFAAAAKQYFGESRIKVDRCGVFSFYDSSLRNQSITRVKEEVESLNLNENGSWKSPIEEPRRKAELDVLLKRRRQHKLNSIGVHDASFMRRALETRLSKLLKEPEACTGVDWNYVSRDIISRYSAELQTLLQSLGNGFPGLGDTANLRNWLQSTRVLTHWFLLPFMEYLPNRPYDGEDLKAIFGLDSPLAATTLERCLSQYDLEIDDLNDEESMLYQAIKDTLAGMCSTVIQVGLGVEYQWLSKFNTMPAKELDQPSQDFEDLQTSVKDWKRAMEELMAWLGWVEKWTSCDDACGVGAVCYIPMWPVSGWPRQRQPPHRPDGQHRLALPHAEWEWGDSKFLWEPVCVNASSYPPEQWE
ncbi:hypothetical protein P154DRAFT_453167 [Amniculicola lignicola CBS 123094]|uniref:Uncharacterized protein n=1 Tax=Amniculicola lignicola CBS 123094 TaxID=1392246 RepID=A0A6A5X4K7_9PLEO|nr:hypothetical protein P154DRAFT_453167 [Amniculicola lignicola CBS 123094]